MLPPKLKVAASRKVPDGIFGAFKKVEERIGFLFPEGHFNYSADHVSSLKVHKINLNRIVDLQPKQGSCFAHMDRDFKHAGRVEQTKRLANGAVCIGRTELRNGVMPFKKKRKRTILAHRLEKVPGNINDHVVVMVDVNNGTADLRFIDHRLQNKPLADLARIRAQSPGLLPKTAWPLPKQKPPGWEKDGPPARAIPHRRGRLQSWIKGSSPLSGATKKWALWASSKKRREAAPRSLRLMR